LKLDIENGVKRLYYGANTKFFSVNCVMLALDLGGVLNKNCAIHLNQNV